MDLQPLIPIVAEAMRLFEARQFGTIPRNATMEQMDEFAKAQFARPIVDVLVSSPVFSSGQPMMCTLHGYTIGVIPQRLAAEILDRALAEKSPEGAVNWLSAVLEVEGADAMSVMAVWGLPIDSEVELLPGVLSIIPFNDLPDSAGKRYVTNPSNRERLAAPRFTIPESALVVKHRIPQVFSIEVGPLQPASLFLERTSPLLNAARQLLCSFGPRIVVQAASWFHYVDAALERIARSGIAFQSSEITPLNLGNAPPFPAEIASRIFQRFFALPPPAREGLLYALERLQNGLMRRYSGDTAVEFCTGFESLLSERQRASSYVMALRAGLLHDGDYAAKLGARNDVAATYTIRNRRVHGGEAFKDGERATVARCAKVFASTVWRLIERPELIGGRQAAWSRVELGAPC